MAVNQSSINQIKKINKLRKIKNEAIIEFLLRMDNGNYDLSKHDCLLDNGIRFEKKINTYVAAKIAKEYFYANPTKKSLSVFAKNKRFEKGHTEEMLKMFDEKTKFLYKAYENIYERIYKKTLYS